MNLSFLNFCWVGGGHSEGDPRRKVEVLCNPQKTQGWHIQGGIYSSLQILFIIILYFFTFASFTSIV